MEAAVPDSLLPVRGLIFDLIATCTKWQEHVTTAVLAHTPSSIVFASEEEKKGWALRVGYRALEAFYSVVSECRDTGKPMPGLEVYGITMRKAMTSFGLKEGEFNEVEVAEMLKLREKAEACEDVAPGLKLLRKKFVLAGVANGPTSSIITINKRNGLEFDTLFCSDVTKFPKFDPRTYEAVIKSLRAESNPGELAVVAAHRTELETAKMLGLRTIYVARAEDRDKDIDNQGFDLVIKKGGMIELARRLGCDA